MAITDPAFTEVLADYNSRLEKEDALLFNHDGSLNDVDPNMLLIPVGEDVGRLMHSLVVGLNAKTIVELGTSYGYSTLFLADAARQTGGMVYSYDVAANKQAYAREQLERADLVDHVTFVHGNAVSLLKTQPGPVDFALIDLWKNLYVPCLEQLVPILGVGATLIADNMIRPANSRAEAQSYMSAVRALPGMQATLLPLGNGIDIAVKQGFS